jgi:hypothetical protein
MIPHRGLWARQLTTTHGFVLQLDLNALRLHTADGGLLLLEIDALRLHVVDGGSDLLQLEVDALHLHAVDRRRLASSYLRSTRSMLCCLRACLIEI